MIEWTFSERDRRATAFGVSALLLLVTISRVIPAVDDWQRDQVSSAVELAHSRESAEWDRAKLSQTQRALNGLRARADSADSLVIAAATSAEASAALGQLLSDTADSAGVTVSSIQLQIDSVARRHLWRAAARVELTGDLAGVASLLSNLEQSTPLLAVRELSIIQPDPMMPRDKPELLQVEIQVETLGRPAKRREDE